MTDNVSTYLDVLHSYVANCSLGSFSSFEDNVTIYLDAIHSIVEDMQYDMMHSIYDALMYHSGIMAMTFFAIMFIALAFMHKVGRR